MKQKYLNKIIILTRSLHPIFKNVYWYSLVHEKNTCKSRASHNYIKQLKPEKYNLLKALIGAIKQYLKFVFRKIYFYNLNPLYINPKNIIVDYPAKYLESIYFKSGNTDFSSGLDAPLLAAGSVHSEDSVKVYLPQTNNLKKSRQLIKQERTHLIDEFISVLDFIFIPFKYLSNVVKYLSNSSYIKRSSGDLYLYIHKEILRSFTGDILIDGLFYEVAFRNLKNSYMDVEKIIYPYEGLAWEKALCIAFQTDNYFNRKRIGVSCTIPAENIFNYWYSNYEMKVMPKPDKLGVIGEVSRIDFRKMFGQDIFVLGSTRHRHLKNYPNMKRQNCEFEWSLVILNSNDEQNRELIEWCKEKKLTCMYKLHPDNRKRDYKDLNTTNGEYSTLMTKQIITTQSSMALEAYLLGVPVIVPDLPSFIDLSPLLGQYRNKIVDSYYRKLFLDQNYTFRSNREMRKIIDEI